MGGLESEEEGEEEGEELGKLMIEAAADLLGHCNLSFISPRAVNAVVELSVDCYRWWGLHKWCTNKNANSLRESREPCL